MWCEDFGNLSQDSGHGAVEILARYYLDLSLLASELIVLLRYLRFQSGIVICLVTRPASHVTIHRENQQNHRYDDYQKCSTYQIAAMIDLAVSHVSMEI